MVRPVSPTWRARGCQPCPSPCGWRPSSAPRMSSSGASAGYSAGSTPSADADDGVGLGERVDVVVAGAVPDLEPVPAAAMDRASIVVGRPGPEPGQDPGADGRQLDR